MDQYAAPADEDLWGDAAPVPSTEAPPGARSSARTWIAAVAGTAAVAVAAFVGAGIASSSTQNLGVAGPGGGGGGPGGFGGPGNGGTIASIDGSTIKMTTQAGTTVNVTTSASTTVTVSSTGQLSDVKVGDNVRVMGTTSGTGIAADQITDSGTSPLADVPGGGMRGAPPAGGNRPPGGGGGGGPASTGVVESVNGSTLTIATADGSTVTVTTSASTVVTLVKPGNLAALKVGDTIQVTGTTGSDGAIAATGIRSGVGPPR